MTTRFISCEGPDDMNALRAVAQCLRWAEPSRAAGVGAGQERVAKLMAGDTHIEISVPSKARGAPGEGKSALARSVAAYLGGLRPQVTPADESFVSLVAAVFDPDDEPASRFHTELAQAIRDGAPAWKLTETAPGTWQATRDAAEQVEVRAVHWRAHGGLLDGLPDHSNLERLLCAVVAEAYPDDVASVARWLAEINDRRREGRRKPATWKAAIHVWLAAVYDKVDEFNAASRFLHQQDECKPHVERLLAEVGLVEDLRHLLGPRAPSQGA